MHWGKVETTACRCSSDSALERGRELAAGPAGGEPPPQTPVGGSGVPEDEPSIPPRREASALSIERCAPASGNRVTKEKGPPRGQAWRNAEPSCAQLLQESPHCPWFPTAAPRGRTAAPGSHGQLQAGTSCVPAEQPFYVAGAGGGSFSTESGMSTSVPHLPNAPGGPACGSAGEPREAAPDAQQEIWDWAGQQLSILNTALCHQSRLPAETALCPAPFLPNPLPAGF